MLQKLGIPEAKDRLEACEEGRVCVTVPFNTLNQAYRDHLWTWQYLESSPQIMKLLKKPLLCEQLHMFRMPPIWDLRFQLD